MDPDPFSVSLLKWDPRGPAPPPVPARMVGPVVPPQALCRPRELGGLEDFFQPYGIRYFTVAKMAELGFTVSTLLDMKDEEIDEMMTTLSHIFRWDLLVGERYGIKAAVRAERRRLDERDAVRRHHIISSDGNDALSQEGLSEEPVQQEKEAAGSGGGVVWEAVGERKKPQQRRRKAAMMGEDDEDDEAEEGGCERQREHPFIVTEPGEVARGKKNGLDYLFHLYEQCRDFLIQVQNLAKERGEKCPTKVTNQVFRYAKKAGATYINKPKMRHYVHCYALHCLDEEASNALRRAFKERGENVGAWRQACYKPLVSMAARQGWDIDAIFNAHPRLAIWYVPTKLRQLCHMERGNASGSTVGSIGTPF
ncbi:floral meristem identity control protein LEAFY (LFY) [Tasmannia lanceolata]|uniref:floral meristem identity control protein LEAFY (LFY) n=1 Tax=Tasmannia lanceolata TaxID=3420 RepID=UPI0040631CE1